MFVYLGDLSIEQLEKRAGIELTAEQRDTLNALIEHNCSKVQGNNKIHIYDAPFLKGKVHELNGYRVRKGVIEYHDTGFIMNLKPNSDSGYDQKNIPFEREVIGNIYDNPELMEVKQNG